MKKTLCVLIAAAAFLSALIFTSCSGGAQDQEKLEEYRTENGVLSSSDGKRSYVRLPLGFQPAGVGDKVGVRDGAFELYELLDADGEKLPCDDWLTEEYAGSASAVYCRQGIDVPDFGAIDFSVCYVCSEDSRVFAISKIEDTSLITALVSSVHDGDESIFVIDDPVKTYTLKFHSDSFPGLNYSVDCLVFTDRVILFNRATGKYGAVPEGFLQYIDSAEKTAEGAE